MSRLVQAVDMVAFLHQRIKDHVEPDPRARRANEMLWSALDLVTGCDRRGHGTVVRRA